MNKKQIVAYFKDKERIETPITQSLIDTGYPNKRDGYFLTAKKWEVEDPNQYWHLINCWAAQSKENDLFDRRIKCGELYFWMAEVSGAVSKEELLQLKEEVLSDNQLTHGQKNRIIRNRLFEPINRIVEEYK